MKDLQRHRQTTQVFAGKHGFVTLRYIEMPFWIDPFQWFVPLGWKKTRNKRRVSVHWVYVVGRTSPQGRRKGFGQGGVMHLIVNQILTTVFESISFETSSHKIPNSSTICISYFVKFLSHFQGNYREILWESLSSDTNVVRLSRTRRVQSTESNIGK